jgi:hypothetical protein
MAILGLSRDIELPFAARHPTKIDEGDADTLTAAAQSAAAVAKRRVILMSVMGGKRSWPQPICPRMAEREGYPVPDPRFRNRRRTMRRDMLVHKVDQSSETS